MAAQNLLPDTTMTVTETDTDDGTKSKHMQQRQKIVSSIPLNIYSSVPDKHDLHYQFKQRNSPPEVKQGNTILPPSTHLWDFSAGSNSDSFRYQQMMKTVIDSTMEVENKRKQNDQLVVRGEKRGASIKRELDRSELETTEPDSISTVPSPAGTIVPRRRQKLGMDRNRSNHPLVTNPSTASLDTLPSDSSLYEISNIITNSLKLTTPHLSEPQNKTILTKEAKDMIFGWKTDPAASSSLSQDTTREIRNSTPAAATRSSQVKLQSSREQETFKPSFQCSSLEEIKESAGPVNYSVPIRSVRTGLPDASESGLRRRDRSNSSPSLSWPLISQDPPADVSILPRAASLPNMKLQSSFEEFTPDFTGDEDDETYWLRCSSPGLYQCRVSGLVFAMKAEGDVSYRIVPWSSRLLSQHGKKPAGPLFDIRCQQQSVAQLHLPHCEIRSTGGCTYLSVAHIGDEGIEFIKPEEITETHVIINITGFSAFGVVKDEDSPNDPVRALVLLFYKPPAAASVRYQINVLLLPKNVALRHVLRFRKKIDRDEKFLETPPHCRLQPKRLYTLSTRPGRQSVRVQPKEAEFDAESYDNYLQTFQVVYENFMSYIKLFLRERGSSSIWNTEVCLSTAEVRRSYGPTRQNIGPSEHLKEIRTSFMERISGPVLKSLLDKLLEIKVLRDAEREAVEGETIRGDKARLLVDMVRRKGNGASSEMIRSLCELDPFFSEHLGLKWEK
ncbi:uncharacterized protein LOC118556801 [Fundulus heteroclitus]|uniref:uncharacterized protein LOC118556801 n=1 Tax=Fundulus heteroclitus TaxID=8078 RepID=UPI00165BC362|nr:uncharacterized protein LOC118556801 [Fundulus heteroclitus]